MRLMRLTLYIIAMLTALHILAEDPDIYRHATELARIENLLHEQPDNSNLLFKAGFAATNLGAIDKALAYYDAILKNHPRQLNSLYNRGYVLKMAGRVDEAIAAYKQLLAWEPNYEAAHFALGHAYLFKGDFEQGWHQHERYLKQANKNADKLRTFLRENRLAGTTIMCIPEGGLGDTINFIRLCQPLHDYGAYVVALVQKPLNNLIARTPYLDRVITDPKQAPPFHEKVTYMSLPAVFNVTEKTIPRTIPYIYPDPDLINFWHEKVSYESRLKIGICWQADVHNDTSRLPVARRGIPLETLYRLSQLDTVALYSLQKNEGLEQLDQLPPDNNLHVFDNLDEEHGSFMDTAALICALDLIITIDSAVAHLAGALGKPVWLLLPYATDWRWIAGRRDSPWYPTMKIFKQPIPFDWDSVITTMSHELQKILLSHSFNQKDAS